MTDEQFEKLLSANEATRSNALKANTTLDEIKIVLDKILKKLGEVSNVL